jgi:hypothetical protein
MPGRARHILAAFRSFSNGRFGRRDVREDMARQPPEPATDGPDEERLRMRVERFVLRRGIASQVS